MKTNRRLRFLNFIHFHPQLDKNKILYFHFILSFSGTGPVPQQGPPIVGGHVIPPKPGQPMRTHQFDRWFAHPVTHQLITVCSVHIFCYIVSKIFIQPDDENENESSNQVFKIDPFSTKILYFHCKENHCAFTIIKHFICAISCYSLVCIVKYHVYQNCSIAPFHVTIV